MPESTKRVPLHSSIFVKLLAIMVGMALCLLLMVVAFFTYVVNPGVGEAVDTALEAYAASLVGRSVDREEVQGVAQGLGVVVTYEGPAGRWTTGDARDQGRAPAFTRHQRVLRSPDGGTYTVTWAFGAAMRTAHARLLTFLLVLMLVVIVVAHEVLRRALRPVRLLYRGVARISAGDLDVLVPRQSRDELGALTDAFNEMVRRVKEMITLRDQLLLDVSHELRSPLTRMKVALALVPEGDKRARMEADVVEMETMISGILELERLRDGRGMRRERRDLVPMLRDVVASFHGLAPGVRLIDPNEELLLEIDAERVRTILRNVVENAVKYSLPDSQPVEITVTPAPGVVVVRIRDDGPGIRAEDRDRIFEPFYRADRSRSRKTGGYGLGLSMARRIMDAHRGSIVAVDNEGRGATFVLTFPC